MAVVQSNLHKEDGQCVCVCVCVCGVEWQSCSQHCAGRMGDVCMCVCVCGGGG